MICLFSTSEDGNLDRTRRTRWDFSSLSQSKARVDRLGVFFIVFALWWHVQNTRRALRSKEKFRGSTTYPCPIFVHWPVESVLKILITSIHFTIELITGYNRLPRPHLGEENAHHTAMLFGFFLGAWVEILVHYRVPLPERLTQVMGFLAFAIEGLMMVFHLHARTLIDAHIHQLLALTIVCSMVGALAECSNPNQFWFIVARSFFALTQGTWFLQAAFVIWPLTSNPYFVWDPQSHRSISLLTMSYAYHLAGNAFVLIIVYLFVFYFDETKRRNEASIAEYKLIDEDEDL